MKQGDHNRWPPCFISDSYTFARVEFDTFGLPVDLHCGFATCGRVYQARAYLAVVPLHIYSEAAAGTQTLDFAL